MFKEFKKIISLLDKKNKRIFPILLFMMVIETLMETVSISLVIPLISSIIDENIINNNIFVEKFCKCVNIHTHKSLIIVCVIILIMLFIGKNIFSLIEYKFRYNFICKSRHLVQEKIFNSILNRPYEYFLYSKTSEIIRYVTDDCDRTFILLDALLEVFANSILSLGIIIVLLIINPFMVAVVMIFMFILSVIMTIIVKPILRKQGQNFVEYAAKYYKNILEAVQGIKIVKITGSKDYFVDEFKKNGEKVIQADGISKVINRVPLLLIESTCAITVLIIILFLYLNGFDIKSLIPTIGAFILALLKIIPSVNKILNAYSSIAFNKDSVNEVIKNFNEEIVSKNEVIEKKRLIKQIELNNITYRYPKTNKIILDNCSITIPAGKSVGVMGASGIGKTTFVDLLLGLLVPEEGKLIFDGREIEFSIDNCQIAIGYVPQNIFILDDTIKNNIAFGIKPGDIDDEKIKSCIKDSQLYEFISSLPEGINTNIGENGIRISGGQKQRIGIARALYKNPDLIVLDEATSSLDLETESQILKSIESFHGEKTIILITHRPQVIENCDFKYKLKDGKFIKIS